MQSSSIVVTVLSLADDRSMLQRTSQQLDSCDHDTYVDDHIIEIFRD